MFQKSKNISKNPPQRLGERAQRGCRFLLPLSPRQVLGTGDATKTDEFSVPKEGWGHFQSKNYVADFGNFEQGFLSMKLMKRRVISGFRVCFFNNCIDIT